MAEITVREALNQALAEELARDANVFLIGEEVGYYQGAFKVTKGFVEEFGPQRVVGGVTSTACTLVAPGVVEVKGGPRALTLGIGVVIACYLGVNAVYLRALGRDPDLSRSFARLSQRRYDLVLGFPWTNQEEVTVRLPATMAVRRLPAQYLWAYKRFRTRPDGEAKLY